MDMETQSLEKEAHQHLKENRYQEAADAFYRAARAYQQKKEHQAAAFCLASAAASLASKAGESAFDQPAEYYEKAAAEAILARDLEYASILFKQAAICHEKEMDYNGFCLCYYKSKEYQRKFLGQYLLNPSKRGSFNFTSNKRKRIFPSFLTWLELSFSSLLWGHGEKPERTVYFGMLMVLIFAAIYSQGFLLKAGVAVHPTPMEAIYFSTNTFATVAYGDFVPLGFNKWMATVESFSGLFILPVFITALCRKYLMI